MSEVVNSTQEKKVTWETATWYDLLRACERAGFISSNYRHEDYSDLKERVAKIKGPAFIGPYEPYTDMLEFTREPVWLKKDWLQYVTVSWCRSVPPSSENALDNPVYKINIWRIGHGNSILTPYIFFRSHRLDNVVQFTQFVQEWLNNLYPSQPNLLKDKWTLR